MNNLTPIEVTYTFDYGSINQKRTFITRPHFDSLKSLTKPLEEDIKSLWKNINDKTDKEVVKQVRSAVDKLENEIKRIIPSYTFIVEDSMVGSAIVSINEGEDAETIIPYNDKPKMKVKYKLLN